MKNKLNKLLVILSLTMALTMSPVLAKDYAYTRIVDKGYSFVVMPDSQTMVSRHPDIFAGIVEGIIKEKNDLDILALIHVGDIVNHHHVEEEFSFAASELKKVPAADIKTVVTPGNHDYTWLWDINHLVFFLFVVFSFSKGQKNSSLLTSTKGRVLCIYPRCHSN